MPVKKLALFVEGQTEFIFLREFLVAIAGALKLRIEGTQLKGGTLFSVFARGFPLDDAEFVVVLFNCGNDGKVASAIRDRYEKLVSDGFTSILGLRDLYGEGRTRNDLHALLDGLKPFLPNDPVESRIIIAVMEIEAWFLKELYNFSRLDPKLTSDFINGTFGVDLTNFDVHEIAHPAGLIDAIFNSVGLRYRKRLDEVEGLVSRLDFEKLYLEDRDHIPALNELLTEIDYFLLTA